MFSVSKNTPIDFQYKHREFSDVSGCKIISCSSDMLLKKEGTRPAGNTAQFVSDKGRGCDVIFIDMHSLGEMKNSLYFLS
jgi:hypothetical protein